MLFDNVGKKICIMSRFLFLILGISAILWIILAVANHSFGNLMFAFLLFISAFIVSLPLYGFGQLIVSIQEIRNKLDITS